MIMAAPILATKLYMPPLRHDLVVRQRLLDRLNLGVQQKLTLISAPAGFGKTTLVSEWIMNCGQPVAWLSLDEGDSDLRRFLTYLVKALQMIMPNVGADVLSMLRASQQQPPSTESILTVLLNDVVTIPDPFILILDDYHMIESRAVDDALTFLLEHLPPAMHLIIATREDPALPLSRLRARGQLMELRAIDLRFTSAEVAGFLNQTMGLYLSDSDIAALEVRTEGWIAGLQLAAISMQGHRDATSFIKSFTGGHHFVLDYLMEEVLQQQSESVQSFLVRTSILDRLCGPLCDAVLLTPAASGQETLEYLEHANLFTVPLDNERHWYRYHHLFRDLLRNRLGQSLSPEEIAKLHIHASQWYENNDLMLEAFRHAAAANEVERAVRLMESRNMSLHIPGTVTAILNWLESLPASVLNAQPSLWCKQAELLLLNGQTTKVEEKLQATETALAAALADTEMNDHTRDLIGKIAAIRSNMALTQRHAEIMHIQASRALEYLHPSNLAYRSSATRDMGFAYALQGNRSAASRTFAKALSIAEASGDMVEPLLATIGLAEIQELENQLSQAADNYERILPQIREFSLLNTGAVYLGLARIYYEWNRLDTAEQYGQQSLQLAQQYSQLIHRFIMCRVFLSRLKLAQGDASAAATLLAEAEESAHRHNVALLMPEVIAGQIQLLLRQGAIDTAAKLAQQYELPMGRTRVLLAQGFASAALEVVESYRQQLEAKAWQNERLRTMVLQALALNAYGKRDKALELLGEVLALAEPGGFMRLFVDEGEPMRLLISDCRSQIEEQSHGQDRRLIAYVDKILASFVQSTEPRSKFIITHSEFVPPLSQRELDVLRLIAQGLSNDAISKRLYLALSTVKGHNRVIFDKLHVESRTEAVARARELGLL